MSLFPVCPGCGASAASNGRFRIAPDVFTAETEPKRGETLNSAAHLECVTCTLRFPLWTYTVGDLNSFRANAVGPDGKPWNPEKEPWFSPAHQEFPAP